MTTRMANLRRRVKDLEAIMPAQPLLNQTELQKMSLAKLSASDRALVEEVIMLDTGDLSYAQLTAFKRWDAAIASVCAETGHPYIHALEWRL